MDCLRGWRLRDRIRADPQPAHANHHRASQVGLTLESYGVENGSSPALYAPPVVVAGNETALGPPAPPPPNSLMWLVVSHQLLHIAWWFFAGTSPWLAPRCRSRSQRRRADCGTRARCNHRHWRLRSVVHALLHVAEHLVRSPHPVVAGSLNGAPKA